MTAIVQALLRLRYVNVDKQMNQLNIFCYTVSSMLQRCSLETLVLVSRHLEDMKNGLGLGLEIKVLVLILVLKKKSWSWS